MTMEQVLSLASTMESVDIDDLTRYRVEGSGDTINGTWYYIADMDALEQFILEEFYDQDQFGGFTEAYFLLILKQASRTKGVSDAQDKENRSCSGDDCHAGGVGCLWGGVDYQAHCGRGQGHGDGRGNVQYFPGGRCAKGFGFH